MKISVDSIVVSDSRRAAPSDQVRRLAESIKESGLLNPITVRRQDNHWHLVAGKHRLEAHILLGLAEIEATAQSYSDLQALQAELAENVYRNDLDALERCQALRRLKEIHEELHSRDASRWRQEVGKSSRRICDSIY